MIIRTVTQNNDWTFGAGVGNYQTGEAAVEQNLKTKLLEWKGDCFFNMFTGVDWNNRLDIGQQNALEQEIKQVALGAFGVVGISDISINMSGRAAAVSITMQTIFEPQAIFSLPIPAIGVAP